MLLMREDCNCSMGPYKPLVSLDKVTSIPVNNRRSSTPVTTKKAQKPVAIFKQEGNKKSSHYVAPLFYLVRPLQISKFHADR